MKLLDKAGLYVKKLIRHDCTKAEKLRVYSDWEWEHWRDGELIGEWKHGNAAIAEGMNYVLDAALSGGSQLTNWYVALMGTDHTVNSTSDDYANSMGTANYESIDYDEATRPAWQEGGVGVQQITNSSNKASFTMGGTDGTIYGAMLVSDSTKGDNTDSVSRKLMVMGKFSSALTGIVDEDVLKVTVTVNIGVGSGE